jgi:hypothetical protein
MRRLLCTAAAALALSGGLALAQQYPYRGFYRSGPGARDDRSIFDRARSDLDRASSYQFASRPDRRRFDEASRELFDFASRFDQGRYDVHILNRAIERLDSVVTHNSLDPRDRGALAEDLRRMRDYREFRSHNRGAFPGPSGYYR